MTKRQTPPGLTSISWIVVVKPCAPPLDHSRRVGPRLEYKLARRVEYARDDDLAIRRGRCFALSHSSALRLDDAVLEVGDFRGLDHTDGLHPHIRASKIIEEAFAAAKENRNDVQLHLVHQTRRDVLLRDAGAAAKRYILASGRIPRLL